MNYAATALQEGARIGFQRLSKFARARRLFIEAYSGQYYNKDHGTLGLEPLNMSFTAVRALVPNIITRNPETIVESDYLMYREYGELLGLSLDALSRKINLPLTLQLGLIDSIFMLGVFKVGLGTSDFLAVFGEERVDPGTIVVSRVDFDNLTFDPITKQLDTAPFIGERIRADRQDLMASGLYDNAVIEKLPSAVDTLVGNRRAVRDLSSGGINRHRLARLHDSVDLIELWLRDPNVIVTLPYQSSAGGKFLREASFYGPREGPYTFLSLTPPVPDNPIPVALAGVWHDLHEIGNRIAKKTLDQAEAQKDILGYRPQYADDARELVGAKNLAAVAMTDPDSAKIFSIGGQNPQNERMTAQILSWFDQFSGNTSMLAGTKMETGVATVANILQQNASTGITYMRDQAYAATSSILRACAWYLHHDPLIQMPLIRRDTIPAQYEITDETVRMISPATTEETQVFLTPEMRRGDFLDFAFRVEHESMAPINWQHRLQQLETLAVRIIPAAAGAAQICAQLGTPFSFERFVTKAAKLMGITWFDEIFQGPELIAQMAMMTRTGPQPQGKGAATIAAVKQNGGAATAKTSPSPQRQARQEAQVGAAQSQADLPIRE